MLGVQAFGAGIHLAGKLPLAVEAAKKTLTIVCKKITGLRARALEDIKAKALIDDVFVQGVMPVRFVPDVSEAYFESLESAFEVRNAWSRHNAFTGVAKERRVSTRLPAIQEVVKLSGMFGATPKEMRLLLPAPEL